MKMIKIKVIITMMTIRERCPTTETTMGIIKNIGIITIAIAITEIKITDLINRVVISMGITTIIDLDQEIRIVRDIEATIKQHLHGETIKTTIIIIKGTGDRQRNIINPI